ncbi:MAG: hypothetical protein MJ218_03625 [Opitutales bacterium]|nr:hypothetical protein [Opitutales bacterium]
MALGALSLSLGITTPCYGYVMVRSGFGELKADDISQNKQQGTLPSWTANAWGVLADANLEWNNATTLVRDGTCTKGRFDYKDHHNLSVALGRRFDVFDTGALGIELEILGAYARYDSKNRELVEIRLVEGTGQDHHDHMDHVNLPRPDFLMVQYKDVNNVHMAHIIPMYLKNQRIVGAQTNIYWEQYLLDWLSAGIGGGIGGAYVCTKFSTLEKWEVLDSVIVNIFRRHYVWWGGGLKPNQNRKYAHTGALLYNFMLFLRAEKFDTLFEVGYRHIGLHQMFDNKMYGMTIDKLANMHSDQIYLGVGRTF